MRPTSCRSAAASSRSGTQPRVELRGLAADRRHADRVLEQAAGVRVVIVRRQAAAAATRARVVGAGPRHDRRADRRARSRRRGTRGSRRSSSGVAPQRRRERRRIGVRRGLERADVELQAVAELLDAAEHAHGVALREAGVEQLDVVPDARVDATARIDELEREVGRAAASCAAAACARRRRRPRRPGLRPARRSRSTSSLGPNRMLGSAQMAVVRPFRAERYDESQGGPARAAGRAAVRRDLGPRSARSTSRAARTTSST